MSSAKMFHCILCGSSGAESLYDASDRRYQLPGSFSIVRCRRCGLVCLHPQPTKSVLRSHYPDEYYTHRPPSRTLKDRVRRQILAAAFRLCAGSSRTQDSRKMAKAACRSRAIREQVEAHSLDYLGRGERVLEIGFGQGEFMDFLRKRGFEAWGIENDAQSYAAMKERGHTVFLGELEKAHFENGSFHFARLRHVLEHVQNPRGMLEELRRILKPGGYVHIEVPNFDGLFARAFGPRWVQLEAPRHFFHFTPTTLARLLEHAGFAILRSFTATHPWQLQGSLQYALDEWRSDHAVHNGSRTDLWGNGRLSSDLRRLCRWITVKGCGDNIITLARRLETTPKVSAKNR